MVEYAKPGVLVSTQWVAEQVQNPALRVIEVSVDDSAFAEGHLLPGAVALHWFRDLEERPQRDIASRSTIERLLGTAGVTPDMTVVFYGDRHNWFGVPKRVSILGLISMLFFIHSHVGTGIVPRPGLH